MGIGESQNSGNIPLRGGGGVEERRAEIWRH
jgi:hypothetical protein